MIPIIKYLEGLGYSNISEIFRSDPDSYVFKAYCEHEQKNFALKVIILSTEVPVPKYNVKFIHENVIQCHNIADFELAGQKFRLFKLDWANLGDLRTYQYKSSLTNFEVLKSVASGLEYLHSHGIVHGDLKLSNILLSSENTKIKLRLSDYDNFFPINNSGQSTNILTPEYSAPEQSKNKTNRVDIWAFGCIAYELCVGKLPFGSRVFGDTVNKIRYNIKFSALGNDFWSIREPFRYIIYKCLKKNKNERYSDISLVRKDLCSFSRRKRIIALNQYMIGLITKKILPFGDENS